MRTIDISDKQDQSKLRVIETCPVCGEVCEEVWHGSPTTTGDGYNLQRREIINGCRH